MRKTQGYTELSEIVRWRIVEHGGLRAAARALGMSAPYLMRLRDGEKTNPTPETLRKLGARKEVKYVLE
jgi:transcriptional regulator with XRE-family HTH domain